MGSKIYKIYRKFEKNNIGKVKIAKYQKRLNLNINDINKEKYTNTKNWRQRR